MKIYITGPMTGCEDWNRIRFHCAELRLSCAGHTVLNPAKHIPMVNPEAITHGEYMAIAKAMIDCCDAVYLLDGWEQGKGAQIEEAYATEKFKGLIYEGDL